MTINILRRLYHIFTSIGQLKQALVAKEKLDSEVQRLTEEKTKLQQELHLAKEEARENENNLIRERQQRTKFEKESNANRDNQQTSSGKYAMEKRDLEKRVETLTDENSRLNTLLQSGTRTI